MRVPLIALLTAMLFVAIGSSAQPPAKNKADVKAKNDAAPESEFDLKFKVTDLALGTHVMGPKVTENELKGHVVLVDYWGVNCGPCRQAMPATAALNSELAEFGLTIVGSHVQEATVQQIKSVAGSLGANFSISIQSRVKNANFTGIPHCILFDHTGACIFRGLPANAEPAIRIAVGKALVEGSGRDKFSSTVSTIAQDLKKGKSPSLVLPRLVALQNSAGDVGTEAKALLGSMTANGQSKFEQAEGMAESNPIGAFFLIEKLPVIFKGTELAKKMSAMIVKLKKEKSVTAEIAARPSLEVVRKIDFQLDSILDQNPNVKREEVLKANSQLLKQMKEKMSAMKKSWPDAKATEEALAIAQKFDIKFEK
ncbi:MAG TPA: hypothetical protein VG097_17140 [Gemmata sp.]|nr:hypothetical protein [Gemmata sp.]